MCLLHSADQLQVAWLSVYLHQMPPWWQNYSSTPSIFIWWHPRSFTSLTVFMYTAQGHLRWTMHYFFICLNVCEHSGMCMCKCAGICGVCVCKTSYHPSSIRHILKVTNQARWPFGKIKDMFLKKRFNFSYNANGHGDLCYRGAAGRC